MGTIATGLLCAYVLILMATATQPRGWRGIIPLHSTRADVERLLGPVADPEGYASAYRLENEVVSVEYSSGPCDKNKRGGWNVPRGVVISVSVAPKTKIRFSDLKIDESKYKKTDGGHVPGYVYYTSEEEGVTIEVAKDEVAGIIYAPSEKDEHLRCPASTTKKICKEKHL